MHGEGKGTPAVRAFYAWRGESDARGAGVLCMAMGK